MILAIAVGLSLTAAGGDPVMACTCADQIAAGGGRDGKALMASRLSRAAIVARGNFVGMRAGEDVDVPGQGVGQQSSNVASRTVAPGRGGAVGTFKVREAVKGNVSGTVEVFSGLGLGDCGAGAIFLGAIAVGADVSVELKPISTKPVRYFMDTCGYMETHRPGG